MYNLTNNKRRNLITSCSCSHFAIYRYYWYHFFFLFYRIAALFHSLVRSFTHPRAHTYYHSFSYSSSADRIAINSIFRMWSIKRKEEDKKNANEPTNRLSSPSLRNCNLCSLTMTHRGDLGGIGGACGGRSLLDG